jgi:hypothetical protein
MCESLVKENPGSMDASNTDQQPLLGLALYMLDFVFGMLQRVAPAKSPQTLGGSMPWPPDHLGMCSTRSWGVVSYCCKRLTGAVKEGRLSEAALEEPLLRQGRLLKWLGAMQMLDLERAARAVLDLACRVLKGGGSNAEPGADVDQLLRSQLSSQELARKVRTCPRLEAIACSCKLLWRSYLCNHVHFIAVLHALS